MTTSITVSYTIDPGTLSLDSGNGHVRTQGLPLQISLGELLHRDPVAYTAIMENKSLGTSSGVVTISAV